MGRCSMASPRFVDRLQRRALNKMLGCTDLFKRLVINKAGRILGYFKLSLLDLLSELPIEELSTTYQLGESADETAGID